MRVTIYNGPNGCYMSEEDQNKLYNELPDHYNEEQIKEIIKENRIMITDNIYLDSFIDNQYSFGYKLLIESGEDTRTLEILDPLCPAVSCFCNSKGNYDEKEEISKVINSYGHVTVYYDPYHINIIIDYLKKHCKHAKFEKMRLPVKTVDMRSKDGSFQSTYIDK